MEEEKEIKHKNIFEKMSCITSELKTLEKDLKVQINSTRSYKAVGEKNVLDAIKPLENKYRIYSYPKSRKIIDKDILVKENKYKEEITTSTLFMRIETEYTFVNIDNPSEKITITTYGDGLDTGDKAPGKAMTYADKYALLKAYKISTGDDPDKEPSPENGYQQKATKKQIEVIKTYYRDDAMKKLLEVNKIDKIENLPKAKASMIIREINKIEQEKKNGIN